MYSFSAEATEMAPPQVEGEPTTAESGWLVGF